MLTISSDSYGYHIQVDNGITVTFADLAFKNSTIKNAYPNPSTSFINNFGRLTLRNCIVSGNTSSGSNGNSGGGYGGGISNYDFLTLTNSTVLHNTASGGPSLQQNGYSGSGGYGGGISNNGTLILTNSTVSYNIAAAGVGATNGNNNGGGYGGGISNSGTLILTNSTVSHNTASGGDNSKTNSSYPGSGGDGGGIANNGRLTLTNSTISDNTASGGIDATNGNGSSGGNGGGISSSSFIDSSSVIVKITNSTISGNTASGTRSRSGGCGGGISNQASTLTLLNSTVSGNTTSGGSVGDNNSNSTNFTPSSNCGGFGSTSVGSGGGGIANFGNLNGSSSSYLTGILTLINSTIAGNTAASSGGGIIDWSSKTDMTFCTIYGNTAAKGGDIAAETSYVYNYSNNGPPTKPLPSHVQMKNSIVAGDRARTGSDIAGALTSDGYNLIQDVTGATFASSKQKSTDRVVKDLPQVFGAHAALQDHGGPTRTYALLSGTGNPALDQIPLVACHINGIITDQRGVKRPDGNEDRCDIGAFEYADTST